MLLRKPFEKSPIAVRIIPFLIFVLLTYAQGKFGEPARYWLYLAKTLVGGWMIWEMRPLVSEMRWALSWEAIVVGVGVCVMWVGLDSFYPKTSELGARLGWSKSTAVAALPWNPHAQFGDGSALAWLFVA